MTRTAGSSSIPQDKCPILHCSSPTNLLPSECGPTPDGSPHVPATSSKPSCQAAQLMSDIPPSQGMSVAPPPEGAGRSLNLMCTHQVPNYAGGFGVAGSKGGGGDEPL